MISTSLSGNEIYCLAQKGFKPGNIVIGNSVYSLGFLGSMQSGIRGVIGGEITPYTQIILEGRNLSLNRLKKELQDAGGIGATGVTSEIVFHGSNIEFLSVGSAIHNDHHPISFTSSSDGQELYCQLDAGYEPKEFVFGNVAYSIGVGKGILGSLKQLARGEVREYSDIFTTTRHLALGRIQQEAQSAGANAVVGIRTSILPFGTTGIQEMLMIGTASMFPTLTTVLPNQIATSDLTAEEMWNVAKIGYMPLELLIGTSVYSLGFIGGVSSLLKSFVKGEINELTTLIYDAREESLGKLTSQAQAVGADDIVGIKTYVYSLGSGLIEFLAIGTAVKYVGDSIKPQSDQLIPQAIIKDKETFYNSVDFNYGVDLNQTHR